MMCAFCIKKQLDSNEDMEKKSTCCVWRTGSNVSMVPYIRLLLCHIKLKYSKYVTKLNFICSQRKIHFVFLCMFLNHCYIDKSMFIDPKITFQRIKNIKNEIYGYYLI